MHTSGATICGGLSNGGELIEIKDGSGSLVDEFLYDPDVGGDGDGNSLQKVAAGVYTACSPTPGLENNCTEEQEPPQENQSQQNNSQNNDTNITEDNSTDTEQEAENQTLELEQQNETESVGTKKTDTSVNTEGRASTRQTQTEEDDSVTGAFVWKNTSLNLGLLIFTIVLVIVIIGLLLSMINFKRPPKHNMNENGTREEVDKD